jgi:hypothetical protein
VHRLLATRSTPVRSRKGVSFIPGQHPALINNETWIAVRDQLVVNAGDHRRKTLPLAPRPTLN